MFKDYATIPASMRVTELSDRIARNDVELIRHQAILIVDDLQKLVGIITRGDVVRALHLGANGNMTVLEAGKRELIVCYPDDVLHEAAAKMLRNDIGRLPVVDRDNPSKIVGYLGRACFMTARLKVLQEEQPREPGWFGGFSS